MLTEWHVRDVREAAATLRDWSEIAWAEHNPASAAEYETMARELDEAAQAMEWALKQLEHEKEQAT